MRSRTAHALLLSGGLAAAILFLFHPYVLTDLYLVNNDYMSFSYPVRLFLQEAQAEGRFDCWNPYQYGGFPLYAMPLWSPFYPVSLLVGWLAVPVQFIWGAMFHLFVCGLFMYLWLRRVRLPFSAAVFGAFLFCFSPFVLVHVSEIDNVMRTIVWIPLIFYAGQVVIDGTEIAGSLLLALALALMILAGHLQFTFYTMVSFVLFYLFSALRILLAGHDRARALKLMGSFGIVLVLAVGLSAIGLFPAWYLTQLSTRAAGISWRFITSYSLTPDQLLNIVSPALWRHWGMTDGTVFPYLGAVTPLLFLVPLVRRRDPLPWFCAAMMLLALLIALGKFSPLFVLLGTYIPGFSLFRGPMRFLLIYVFFAATLAAHALPLLADRARRDWLPAVWAAYSAVLTAALLVLTHAPATVLDLMRRWVLFAYTRLEVGQTRPLAWYLDRLQPVNLQAAQTALGATLLLLAGFGLLLLLRGRLAPRPWLAYLLLLLLPSYVLAAGDYVLFRPLADFTPPRPLTDAVRRETAGESPLAARVAQYGYLWFNQGTALPLACLDGYGGIITNSYARYVTVIEGEQPDAANVRASVAIRNLVSPVLNLAAARHLIAPWPLNHPRLVPLTRDGEFILYRNAGALPPVFAVPQRRALPEAETARVLQDEAFYPPRTVLVPPGTPFPGGLPAAFAPAAVTFTPRLLLPDRREWTVRADGPAYVVFSENWYPFWECELNGRPQPLFRAYHYLLGTHVPAGTHRLTLRFVPRDLYLGICTTLLTLLVFLLALYWTVKRRLIHNIRDDENVLFDYLTHTSAALALVRSMEGRLFRRSSLQPPVLDIGCGDGLFAAIVFFQDIDVGIDLDRVELRKRARPERYRSRANANASALPFASGHFATVISNCVVEHVPDHTQPLREIRRVLRPGGKYVFTTHSHLYGQYLFWYAACHRLGLHRLGDWYAATVNRVFKHCTMLTPDEWTQLLEAAGFRDVRISFYLSRRAMWWFDLLLPMSVPSRCNKALFGRWAVLPRVFLAAIETHLFKFVYREDPPVGAGMCIEAYK